MPIYLAVLIWLFIIAYMLEISDKCETSLFHIKWMISGENQHFLLEKKEKQNIKCNFLILLQLCFGQIHYRAKVRS